MWVRRSFSRGFLKFLPFLSLKFLRVDHVCEQRIACRMRIGYTIFNKRNIEPPNSFLPFLNASINSPRRSSEKTARIIEISYSFKPDIWFRIIIEMAARITKLSQYTWQVWQLRGAGWTSFEGVDLPCTDEVLVMVIAGVSREAASESPMRITKGRVGQDHCPRSFQRERKRRHENLSLWTYVLQRDEFSFFLIWRKIWVIPKGSRLRAWKLKRLETRRYPLIGIGPNLEWSNINFLLKEWMPG